MDKDNISRGEDMVNVLPPHFQNFMQVFNKFRDALERDPLIRSVTWFETYQDYRQGYRFDVQFLQRKYLEQITQGVKTILDDFAHNGEERTIILIKFLEHNLNLRK